MGMMIIISKLIGQIIREFLERQDTQHLLGGTFVQDTWHWHSLLDDVVERWKESYD